MYRPDTRPCANFCCKGFSVTVLCCLCANNSGYGSRRVFNGRTPEGPRTDKVAQVQNTVESQGRLGSGEARWGLCRECSPLAPSSMATGPPGLCFQASLPQSSKPSRERPTRHAEVTPHAASSTLRPSDPPMIRLPQKGKELSPSDKWPLHGGGGVLQFELEKPKLIKSMALRHWSNAIPVREGNNSSRTFHR